MAVTTEARSEVRAARTAVVATFFLNGFAFATWASRIPAVRHSLGLGPATLGLLLLSVSVGALIAMPSAGLHVQRFGAKRVVRAAAVVEGVGLLLLALGAAVLVSVPVTALGLFMVGLGTGTWDVSMNVEGAEVERLLGRSVMPRFHAAFSLTNASEVAAARPACCQTRAARPRTAASCGSRSMSGSSKAPRGMR